MNFPILHTARLILRQVLPSDAPIVLRGYSDPRVYQHMSISYHTLDEVQAQLDWYVELYTQHTGIWWGICLRDTGEMIGNGGFHLWSKKHLSAELGYWLLPDYQHLGFAKEAVSEMLRYGYQSMLLHRIEAIVEGDNTSSSRLMESLSFHLDGVRRACEWSGDKFIDLQIWSKLASEQEGHHL
ncbi:MAG: GNAT family N-acetyltransferase [Saprospiraceae bacterium]